MAEKNKGNDKNRNSDESKEPFIGSADRPEVRIDLDQPISELRVRDLAAILGHLTPKSVSEIGKAPIKDFFDKPFPEVAKDFLKEVKIEKVEKPEKPEKFEKLEKHEKPEKLEKPEHKEFKNENKEFKIETKELKLEKIENDGVFDPGRGFPGPDPRFESVLQAVAGLSQQVSALTDQVESLRKRNEG